MARLRSPSLFHTVTEHPAMLFMAMFVAASDVTGFMFFGPCSLVLPEMSGRRSCKAPGCLKSESEERETWTAESLRAASSNGEGFGLFRESAAMEETSAVDVSGQHYERDGEQSSERTEWDLVKRCDLPRSNLFNLRV